MLRQFARNSHKRVRNSLSPTPGPLPISGSLWAHARFKLVLAAPSSNDPGDIAFGASHYTDFQGGTTTQYPSASYLSTYCLNMTSEIDTGAVYNATGSGGNGGWFPGMDNPSGLGDWVQHAADYATTHGLDVEDFFLHSRLGDQNMLSVITSISATGVVILGSTTAGRYTSYPYKIGNTYSVSGATFGNGVWTIASIQKNGLTFAAYTASAGTGGKLFQPGDGTKTFNNRRFYYKFTEWRNILNAANAGAQAMRTSIMLGILASKPGTNGIFYDEHASGDVSLDSCIQSVEYGAFSAASKSQYCTDLSSGLLAQKAALAPHQFIRVNIGSYQTTDDVNMATAAGGAHCEQGFTLNNDDTGVAIGFYRARINAGIFIELVDGSPWSAGNPAVNNVSGAPESGSNYPDRTARCEMSVYSMYLMLVDANIPGTTEKRAVFSHDNSAFRSVIPQTARWSPAFEVNIGQPMAPYDIIQTGNTTLTRVPPPRTGFVVYSVFRRNFTLDGTNIHYMALFNSNPNTPSFGVSGAIVVPLPAPPAGRLWAILNRDGTFKPPGTTTVTMQPSEGLIFRAV